MFIAEPRIALDQARLQAADRARQARLAGLAASVRRVSSSAGRAGRWPALGAIAAGWRRGSRWRLSSTGTKRQCEC
ncbi:MAG: hypothetical protein ACRC35_13940 [Angustibacter sp.]